MARLLTELGHDEADVLGISWGGGVAQHFAMFQRQRCRRLVLVSTATGSLMVPARPRVLARMVTPRRYLDRQYLREAAPHLYGGSARSQPDHVSELMNAENRVGPALGYVYQLLAGAGWTSLPFLPLIRQPTLILSGDDDPLIPLANARLMHSLIPRSQLTCTTAATWAWSPRPTSSRRWSAGSWRPACPPAPEMDGAARPTTASRASRPRSRGGPR